METGRQRVAPGAPAERLRALLGEDRMHVMPCCFDALSARLVERAGFRLGFMSGFAVSATRLAAPDTGLISFGEMLDQGHLAVGVRRGGLAAAEGHHRQFAPVASSAVSSAGVRGVGRSPNASDPVGAC